MTDLAVACSTEGRGWSCHVEITDPDGSSTVHLVAVASTDLARLDPGAADPVDLVRRSFDFLLAREPKESILPSFDLMVIGRYFPDYARTIGPQGRVATEGA